MHTHNDNKQNNKSQASANEISQKKVEGAGAFSFTDNRSTTLEQRNLQNNLNQSRTPNAVQLQAVNALIPSGTVLQLTTVNYIDAFAAKHILVGSTDEQAINRAVTRDSPPQFNTVLTDSNAIRDAAFEAKLTTECADAGKPALHEFPVAVNAKKTTKARDDAHPIAGRSKRKHAGNYDVADVASVTAVLNAEIAQNADEATIKSVMG